MGWDRPEKKKKILVPNSVQTRPGEENSEKQILHPNSFPTHPELENSKKNSKKIHKIKKVNSGIISIQNGLRVAKKEGKKF